jgi:cytochrome c-type biogenesis protein CcmH/NrfG
MAHADAAEIEERVAKLRELLHRDPDDPTSWFTLGRALFFARRWSEIGAFGHALARNPPTPRPTATSDVRCSRRARWPRPRVLPV